MKFIMPMAGLGSRFGDNIKPLIDVNGVPMFVHATRCAKYKFTDYIFIVRKEHNLKPIIKQYYPDAHVIEIDYTTEGTACTLMLAKQHWQDGSSIFVSNCDQHIEYTGDWCWTKWDGAIACFDCPEQANKWSYAQTNSAGFVTRVAEKDPISELATAGWYYWQDGRQFEQSVVDMMAANDRVNNEFYTCPTYNYLLKQGCAVKTFTVDKMAGIGTPEDLDNWLNS